MFSMDISAYQHMHIRMSTRGKRPLRNLTPTDKVRAIQRIHNGETKASVSRDIGVPESTLRGWCKNEQKLRFMCRQVGTNDQLVINVPCMETPPEKRLRFDNHIQPTKSSHINSFNEFLFNHSPVGAIVFPPTDNSMTDKVFTTEVVKGNAYFDEPPDNTFKIQTSSLITNSTNVLADDYPLLQARENVNLLSLLYPAASVASICDLSNAIGAKSPNMSNETSNTATNTDDNMMCSRNYNKTNSIASSLTVKNWAKDSANSSNGSAHFIFNNNKSISDWNNNTSSELRNYENNDILRHVLPVPPQVLQIPNIVNKQHSENSKSALLDWCKIFNASLSFLALTTAAATLHPNISLKAFSSRRTANNEMCKKIAYVAASSGYSTNVVNFSNSDLSNDSICESEPEDLSLRPATITQISSPSHDYSQSHVTRFNSFSTFNNDVDN